MRKHAHLDAKAHPYKRTHRNTESGVWYSWEGLDGGRRVMCGMLQTRAGVATRPRLCAVTTGVCGQTSLCQTYWLQRPPRPVELSTGPIITQTYPPSRSITAAETSARSMCCPNSAASVGSLLRHHRQVPDGCFWNVDRGYHKSTVSSNTWTVHTIRYNVH